MLQEVVTDMSAAVVIARKEGTLVRPEFALETTSVSERDIRTFCNLVGDRNPIHLDHEAAAAHGYSELVVPGALIFSLYSGFLQRQLPDGVLIRGFADAKFSRPVLRGESIRFSATTTDMTQARQMTKLQIDGEIHDAAGRFRFARLQNITVIMPR